MRNFCYIFLFAITLLWEPYSYWIYNSCEKHNDVVCSYQDHIIYCGPDENRYVVNGKNKLYLFLKKTAKYAKKHQINTIVIGRCKIDTLGNLVSVRLKQYKRKNGKELPVRLLRKFKAILQNKTSWNINEEKSVGDAFLYLKIYPDSLVISPNLLWGPSINVK